MNIFAPQTQAGDKSILVEFKAGMMHKDENSRTVRPDTRKGLVQLKQTPGDNLIHFIWKDRTTGEVGTDLIIFPDDAHFRRVKECKTGRVYLLDFKSSDKKLFFWLQEAKEDKDEQNCKDINKYMNEPPQPEPAGGGLAGLEGVDQNALVQMLNMGMLPPQLQRYVMGAQGAGGAGGAGLGARGSNAAATPAEPENNATTEDNEPAEPDQPQPGPIQQVDLENILRTLGPQVAQSQGPSLGNVFDADKIIESGVLNDEAVRKELTELLPEQDRDKPGILEKTLRTPQFRQAADMLSAACQQEGATILSSFGLDPTKLDLGSTMGTAALLKAILQYVKKNPGTEEEKKDDNMDLS